MKQMCWLAVLAMSVGALGQVPVPGPTIQNLTWDCVRPSYVIAGDLNGDGWDDFAVACHSCNEVLVGLNPTGDGCPVKWPAPKVFNLADAPTALAWGLFGSGVGPYEKRVVATTQYTPGWSSFRVTDATASLTPLRLITAVHLITGDFNGDGALDVAILDPVGLTVLFISGRPAALIPPIDLKPHMVGGQPAFLAAADFDRDGDLDLVVASGTSLHFFENKGSGAFAHKLVFPVAVSLRGIAIADFDNDGRDDLAVVDPAFGAMIAIRNMGCWSFEVTSRVKLDKEPVFVVALDANRDGRIDFAVAEYGGDLVSIVRNMSGGRFQLERTIAVGRNPISLAVGDFDRNGIPDLVVALSGGGPDGSGPAVQIIYNPLCTADDCTDKAPCCGEKPPCGECP